MSRHNNNFQDPIGLVMRMLASKHRAAYAALFREGLRLGATPIDAVLSRFENRRLRHATTSNHPLILIVGAPRSGTTLVYQALAHHLNVTFPSNISAILKRSPITSALLQRRFSGKGTPDFRNYYGQTRRMSDCNDAFDLWNRWLGDDRYYPCKSLTASQASEMQALFAAWTNAFNKPFLNKNNRNAFAVELLAEHLPNARFVVVRRNPVFVAQSLIIARQKVQGSKQTGWGLESSSTTGHQDPLAHVDAVCQQINSIDAEMNRQLSMVDPARVVDMTYESFCESPQHGISAIASKFDGLSIDPAAGLNDLQSFAVSRELTISAAEHERIRLRMRASTEHAAVRGPCH